VVRLIRSKGVGIYFVTQSPADIPDSVLGQLGNRVQHALRAYTPKERKAVRVAAQSFRENPALDTETVISELGVGEALVSTLQAKGVPSVVQRTLIRPPSSRMGKATAPSARRCCRTIRTGAATPTAWIGKARMKCCWRGPTTAGRAGRGVLKRRETSAQKRSGRSATQSGTRRRPPRQQYGCLRKEHGPQPGVRRRTVTGQEAVPRHPRLYPALACD
jgi:hypothetical protein